MEDAEQVWLLMGRDYRISRSIRLQWFFQHLNLPVSAKSYDEVDSSEEIEVLAVLPAGGGQKRVGPNTKLSFVGREYRFVFCIDMSPSIFITDTMTGNNLIDDLLKNLKNTLTGLVQEFCIPGSSHTLKPTLHLTILAHTHIKIRECQVLVQGYCVTAENLVQLLELLKRKIHTLENAMAEQLIMQNKMDTKRTNDGSLFYIIRDGLLALQLLPDNASAAIVVVTDGVLNLENAFVADALLSQVRTSTAVCSFLQVGNSYTSPSIGLGYVPHCSLMQFIATATSGAYLLNCPPVLTKDFEMNLYHRAFFCWNFQRDIDQSKIDTWKPCLEHSDDLPPQPQQTMRYMEFDLQTKLSSVLSLRSREGYITDGIRFTKDHSQIEVKLVWPWKEHVTIEYIAKAAWPFESNQYSTHVIVNVSGPYEFLVDITSSKPKNPKTSQFRKIVLQKFEMTMKCLEMSDQLLVQLQLFPIHPYASQILEAVSQGSPLFFMPPNSSIPILALQYGSKGKKSKSPEMQFANFWKQVVTMDTKIWSKWMHCHRYSILLQHDRTAVKDLFVAQSTGNYTSVHCRAAITSFNRLLKDWCSFTLLENHSYIKFMSTNGKESTPSSFCMLRLNYKGLCIVIRLAFLAGTPGYARIQEVENLRNQIGLLKANLDKSEPTKQTPCVIFLTKQFERILVKYDFIPEEVRRTVQQLGGERVCKRSTGEEGEKSRVLQEQQRLPGLLSEYLFNQRWVWTLRENENIVLDAQNAAQILQAITFQRLHEGFNFCSSSKGIISMVKELPVTVGDSDPDNLSNCCVIQYVVFPPHPQLVAKRHDDSTNDVEGDLHLIVEVWVEPQMGVMGTMATPLDYIYQADYWEVPAKIFKVDSQIITEIGSYALLHTSSVEGALKVTMKETVPPTIPTDTFQSASIVHIPFLFQVLPLLKKCRLILSLYPMIKDVPQESLLEPPNEILLGNLFKTISHMTDYEVELHESNGIADYIRSRCHANKQSVWREEKSAPVVREACDDMMVNCYVKSFGGKIVIIVMPVSVDDLDKLVQTSPAEDEVESDRRNFPVFIFECDYASVKTIPPKWPSFDEDVVQDYSSALSESALTPRHLNQKLPDNRSNIVAMVCQAVYDRYFWALVTSVYRCLQEGYLIDSDDVELSIELVCEESIREIDITDFIRTICSHFQTNTLVTSVADDIVFPDYHDNIQNKTLLKIQKRNSSGSSSYLSSQTSLKSKTADCENRELQEEIRKIFVEILKKYFTRVPNNPFFMFFRDNSEDDEKSEGQEVFSTQSSYNSFEDENMIILSDVSSPITVDPPEELTLATAGEIPLFLHLTCSCHYKSSFDGNVMRPISVTALPACLDEILHKMDDHGRCVDPYSPSLKLTLDLICLTQPAEPDEGVEWRSPKDHLQRQDSSDSFYSMHSSEASSEHQSRKRLLTDISKDESYMKGNSGLESLPDSQKRAVEKTIVEIEWLLKDEIASALRNQGPINEDSLNTVAQHVKNSRNAENCIFEQHDLRFVTGIESAGGMCLPLFIFELDSANIKGHVIKRIGKFYCVVLESADSELGSVIPYEEVKENAKTIRKKFGHRRSQSDFTRQSLRQQPLVRSLSHPSMRANYMEEVYDSCSRHTSTSKDESSLATSSMISINYQQYVQRSRSYTEANRERNKQLRRQFSLPFLPRGGGMYVDKNDVDMATECFDTDIEDEEYVEEEKPQLFPDFWLLMDVSEESVDIYLHRRRSEQEKKREHQQNIYDNLKKTIDRICKVVNQRILLDNMYKTNQCHNLLIAEDDESAWDTTHNNELIVKERSSNQPFGSIVHADYMFQPGHFECDMVWQEFIPIHSRLRVVSQAGGKSLGFITIQSVLEKFQIGNRKNLFVYRDENVFYFKINEVSGHRSLATPNTDDEHIYISRTSSFTSISRLDDHLFERQESYHSTQLSARTDDTLDELQDRVQFSVFGIRQPKDKFKKDMIQTIKRKLDTSNLELINRSLFRNHMTKLTPEDVTFIQTPGEGASRRLVLAVSRLAAQHLNAVMYYLRQHLLQHYNTPRYSSNKHHFRDAHHPIPSCDVYLILTLRGLESSGKGIGVCFMKLVDNEGHRVRALPCYPSLKHQSVTLEQLRAVYKEMTLLAEVDTVQNDPRFNQSTLIEFSIWERGNINMEVVVRNLTMCTQHALSDTFLEYELLCTPVCSIPHTLHHTIHTHNYDMKKPMHMNLRKFYSEPTTPNSVRCESPLPVDCESYESNEASSLELSKEEIEKRRSEMPSARSSPSCHRKQELIRRRSNSSRTSSNVSDTEPPVSMETSQTFHMLSDAEFNESWKATRKGGTWQELEVQRRVEVELRKERRRHENGLQGELNPTYWESGEHLLDEAVKGGSVTIFKQEGYMQRQYSLELLMSAIIEEINTKCPDIKPKTYLCTQIKDETSYLPYKPTTETSEPIEENRFVVEQSVVPGNEKRYIVIGRNAHKWHQSIGTDETELSDDEEGRLSQEEQCSLRFHPLLPGGSQGERRSDTQPPSCITHTFVPRQKFFLLILNGKKISFYTYNFPGEVNLALEKQLKRLMAWYNVRTHMNDCWFMQKVGLFHHKHFVQHCPNKYDPDVATFSSSTDRSVITPLMKGSVQTIQPSKEKSTKQLNIGFDDIFRDISPLHALHRESYSSFKDHVRRQAHQYMDVRNRKLEIAYQQDRLKEVYTQWRGDGGHVPVSEESLALLKKNCRFVHYCDAPFLFAQRTATQLSRDATTTEPQQDWVGQLQFSLVQQYIQYLQTLGLCLVQLLTKNGSSRQQGKGKQTKKPSKPQTKQNEERPLRYHLQKTSSGGIILMEVFAKGNQLCYSLLAFSSRFLHNIRAFDSHKDERNFFEDCFKFKDLTHLQSFSYDFHVRNCQLHLAAKHSMLPSLYNIEQLMTDIIEQYPQPPRFSRCMITNGAVELPCSPSLSPSSVFGYLVNKGNKYNLHAISLEEQHLLVYTYITEKQPVEAYRMPPVEYDGFVAVHLQESDSEEVLMLPYFLILANKKEFYPRPQLISSLRRHHRLTDSFDASQQVFQEHLAQVKQKGRVRFCTEQPSVETRNVSSIRRVTSWSHEHTKISPSNVRTSVSSNASPDGRFSDSGDSDISIPADLMRSSTLENYLRNEREFVEQEKARVHDKLAQTFARALSNCWRDMCWSEMLTSDSHQVAAPNLNDSKKRKKSSLINDESPRLLQEWHTVNHMTHRQSMGAGYQEMRLLLGLTCQYFIRDIDPRLLHLLHSTAPHNAHLIDSLLRSLSSQYDVWCRRFQPMSENGNVMLCILTPENLDMMVLADVKENHLELSVVYRLKPVHSPLDTISEDILADCSSVRHIEHVMTCIIHNHLNCIDPIVSGKGF